MGRQCLPHISCQIVLFSQCLKTSGSSTLHIMVQWAALKRKPFPYCILCWTAGELVKLHSANAIWDCVVIDRLCSYEYPSIAAVCGVGWVIQDPKIQTRMVLPCRLALITEVELAAMWSYYILGIYWIQTISEMKYFFHVTLSLSSKC